ncbi:MAG: UDP-3-O-acyl-N-acetylglucosamine deacetylase [bacterium]|nr:UDP-3-O-acyl-N-acetylglucosamine deacetylase [bacterium]
MKQKTLKKEIYVSGTGLHTGSKISIKILPAKVNTGIRFKRIDKLKHEIINGNIDSVINSKREVTLGRADMAIHTVEHLLAAFSGLEIDNAIIEMDADEPPVVDGSSRLFVDLLMEVGLEEQDQNRKFIIVDEPIWASSDDRYLVALPSDEMKISFTIDFAHPVIKTQYASFKINPEIFRKEIASARTFGFLNEVSELRKNDLAHGGSLENAIVIGDTGILNDSLRFENECVRHKILDLIGDLYLLEKPILAHIIAIKSGHSLNIELVRKIKNFINDNKNNKVHIKGD